MATSHGRRTIETIAEWVPHKATIEYAEEFEGRLAQSTEGLSVLPGVTTLLEKIPLGRMGICTSGNKNMAQTRLTQCNMPVPTVMATGDTVNNKKKVYFVGGLGAGRKTERIEGDLKKKNLYQL